MLKGKMDVVDDLETKKELWKGDMSVYYSGGVDGGDFIVLKFTTEKGRYYSNFKSEDFEIK